ncbi:hypothetical protein TS85_19005 [Sphingomonas hengshuiensis]|uniref:Uncharacterized protein n=2 Tax=Sphingomonas hengshuiensis TaxID=1609977 RepID=A0A7U4JAU9_9SPHN|nr:hypothetical protein TS85_19005 [Sphingomonas hengshuiensis]
MTHEKMAGLEFVTDELPFLKRDVFRDEKEYRLIARSQSLESNEVRYIDIDLSLIDTIVFSPLAPSPLVQTLIRTLKAMPGAAQLNYHHSHLMNNQRWRDMLEEKAKIAHPSL